MNRTLAKILYVATMIVGIVIIATLADYGRQMASILTACVTLAVITYLSFHLRCPHCGAWPRKGSFFHHYCPRCGGDLDD